MRQNLGLHHRDEALGNGGQGIQAKSQREIPCHQDVLLIFRVCQRKRFPLFQIDAID